MRQTRTPVSKVMVALMWLLFLGLTIGWIVFLLARDHPSRDTNENPTDLARIVLSLVVGGFFLACGIGSYLVLLATNCFTFNFQQPIWSGVKAKLYLSQIVVLTGLALGLGFGLSPFIGPGLTALGVSGQIAFLLPVMAMVVVLQVVQIFFYIWAPLERRLITKRLQARGISPAQLQTAMLVGISNPQQSSFKKFSKIEEDIGALWIGPGQLVYWGDNEAFGITPEQLVQVERKGDTGSTSMLAALSHVILHVQMPDGGARQIRLHTEGHWTIAGRRSAMDELEEKIVQWQTTALPAAPAQPL